MRAARRLALAGLGLLLPALVLLAWAPLLDYGEDARRAELDRHRDSTRACTTRDDCTLVVGLGELGMQILVTLGAALVLAGLLTDGVGMRLGGLLLLAAWVPPALVLGTGAMDAGDARQALVRAVPLLVVFGAPGALALLARRWTPSGLSSRAA